ncbi:hypothetical protein DNFV4_03832 [Nitrospira tepida]|uniref:Lipoprotein n=1 Tax=Nitrospira tepida TaxID=2973512 RepID=A0AA86N2P1_9BACT|nr:hypothetical protein [Nitrospira tepida]CAI4033396.1 hypothetical protein DNFV4_03832 [Nitrospira tepida]
MAAFRPSCLLLGIALTLGCVSLSGGKEQFFVCSYEVVWDAALNSVKDRSLRVQDKQNGLIETNWTEMEGQERPYGLFRREGFGNKERARLTLALKQQDDITSVSVLETRQRWHARGGATTQATKWWPVEPSEVAMNDVVNQLNSTLQDKGCAGT